jgi:tetratricopeptide (TPR) repeat protein
MSSVPESWNRAQQLEASGGWNEARSLYEAILATEPQHVPARLRMSRLEQFADRYVASKDHVLRAADAVRANASTRLMAYVTARLLEFAEEHAAASLILAVSWSDPHVIRQSPALAQHLWLTGRYEDSLRFIDTVAPHAPGHALLSYTRANVLRYLGDIQGAQREYEKCLTLSPDLADAHWSLATHARARPPLARVPRIREALTRCPRGGFEETHLLYALFHELDAAGETDEAWSALSRAAGFMRQRLKFDSQQEAARLDALMRVTVSDAADAAAAPVPIFVVGMPRTGTTLLDRMLGNHSSVVSVGERNDLSAAASEASGRFFRSALQATGAETLQRMDARRAGELYLERMRRVAPGARYVVDKNPQNLFNVPLIVNAIPAARVLCLRRDPMDACFSNLKELFQGDAYPYSYSLEDLADHCLRAQRWMEHWQSVAPRSVRVVSYEDIVRDAASAAANVLDFVGLDMESGLHDITRNSAPVSTASSSQVREGIHARGVGAWKRYERHLQPLRTWLGA